eukprot:Filipodium_phascolosomae@DN3093_c0_g1_i1.p2
MLGFGLMDNLVMIQAGEIIDTTIGVTFGLSTITAAAFGQIFSDVSGVCFGGTIEAFASRLGLPNSFLTPGQRNLGFVKLTGTVGRVFGVICGCSLGMLSLLLIDSESAERMKRQQELGGVMKAVTQSAERTINADIEVFVIDQSSNVLHTTAYTDTDTKNTSWRSKLQSLKPSS